MPVFKPGPAVRRTHQHDRHALLAIGGSLQRIADVADCLRLGGTPAIQRGAA